MIRPLISLAALALLSTTGHAQDDVLPTPDGFTWTGFYIGATGGGAFGDTHWDYATGDTLDNAIDGLIGGGQVGIQFQAGMFVVGAEGSGLWNEISGHPAREPNADFDFFTDLDELWTVGGRLGVAPSPAGRILFYGTGGYAYTNAETYAVGIASGMRQSRFDAHEHHDGWYTGFGAEGAIWRGLIAGFEYRHYEFDERLHLPAASPIDGRDVDFDLNSINFRISYLLNPLGMTAVEP